MSIRESILEAKVKFTPKKWSRGCSYFYGTVDVRVTFFSGRMILILFLIVFRLWVPNFFGVLRVILIISFFFWLWFFFFRLNDNEPKPLNVPDGDVDVEFEIPWYQAFTWFIKEIDTKQNNRCRNKKTNNTKKKKLSLKGSNSDRKKKYLILLFLKQKRDRESQSDSKEEVRNRY